jgi:hypothetical protein
MPTAGHPPIVGDFSEDFVFEFEALIVIVIRVGKWDMRTAKIEQLKRK